MKYYLLHIIVFLTALLAALLTIEIPSSHPTSHIYGARMLSQQNTFVNQNSIPEEISVIEIPNTPVGTNTQTDRIYDNTNSASTLSPLLSMDLMSEVSSSQLPPLDAGMVNVTGGFDGNSQTAGYRVNPRPGEFAIAVPYDPSLLPQGFTEDDIQTYVYDRQYHRWAAIQRDSVNEAELLVCSRFRPWEKGLPHTQNDLANPQDALAQVQDMMSFASQGEGGGDSPLDFINAVLKTPEMPETSAYTPTSIKELKAADPLEGLTLIQPPTANNSGTANLSYPIEIPAGRQGMQPNLALTYSSGGGNGWLGVGWDISIPSITVETRWGVPRYDTIYESEVYVYEGEQLVTKDESGTFRLMPHRTNQWISRTTLGNKEQFYPRRNEAFDSIVRHGSGPSEYWWSVTHRNGVTDYYGKYASDTNVNNSCVLRTGDNNASGAIAHWALAESVDPFGNSVRYYYDIVYSKGVSNGSWGKQIYADSISYTCFNSSNSIFEESGKYSVKFQRKYTDRADIITSLNRGLKEVTADVLCHLDIKFQDTLFRQYLFVTQNDYTSKYKTILTDIVRIDSPLVDIDCFSVLDSNVEIWSNSQEVIKHTAYTARYHFDYYEYPVADSLYAPSVQINNLPNDNISLKGVNNTFISTALGATKTKSWNIGGTGAVGLGPDISTTIATIGANATYSNSKSEGLMTLVDLDGDGLADKLFKKNDTLYFRKRLYSPDLLFAFDNTAYPIVGGVTNFLRESGNSISLGAQISCGIEASNGFPAGWSTTTNYMTDINGDGLVDIVTEEGEYFGKYQFGQAPAFSPINTIQTTIPQTNDTSYSYISSSSLGTGNCGGVIFDGEIDTNIACLPSYTETVLPLRDTTLINTSDCVTQIVGYKSWMPTQEVPNEDSLSIFQPKISSNNRLELFALDSMIIRTVCDDKRDCSPQQYAPDFDAVRVWVAPDNDTYRIISSVQLIPDDTTLFRQSRYADGVYCSIEHNTNCQLSADGEKIVANQPENVALYNIVCPDTIFVDTIEKIINKNDIIFFRLQSKQDRSFDKVNWKVRIEALNSMGQGDDIYGRDKGVFNSDSDFVLTGKNMFQAFQSGQVWISGRVQYQGVGEPAEIVIKRNNTIEYSHLLSSDSFIDIDTNFNVDSLDNIIVKIEHINNENPQWPNIVFTPLLKYYPSDTSLIKDTVYYYPQIQLGILHPTESPLQNLYHKYFGELYRGWGQFAYNRKGSNSSCIELSRLELPQWYTANSIHDIDTSIFSTTIDTADLNNSLLAAVDSVNNPLSSVINPSASSIHWIEMTAYNEQRKFRGAGLNTAVSALCLDNTEPTLRIPVADSVPGSLSYGESDVNLESIPIYDHPVRISVSGAPVQTIRKRHWNISTNSSLGANAIFFSFGMSNSIGGAYIQSDYMDMNGDRYPDPISTGGVQYSMPWGGIGDLQIIVLPENDHLSASLSFSSGQTQGRCYPDPRKLPSNNAKFGKTSLTGSGTLSQSEVTNKDISDYMLIDINGDGLPDMVNASNKTVCLNAGYKFLNAESWNVNFIREGKSSNMSTNVGISGGWEAPDDSEIPANSYSLAQVSISGGTGLGSSYNYTTKQLADMNGDGLPDKIETTSNGITVKYNLGNGQWSSADNISGVTISKNRSSSEDVNLGVTAGFTAFAAVKVNVGAQTSPYNRSLATDLAQLVDIDGDGYPDYITSDNETSVTIRHNKAGKTNLLRQVTNFTGSTIDLDYELSEPCFEKPQRSWNLSRVETHNNVDTCPVGGNHTLTTFSYGNPHYDRYERMEFGYDTVKTIVHNTDSLDSPYRQNIMVYNNINLAKRGRKVMEAILDGNGAKYVVKYYETLLKDFLGNIVSDDTCNIEGVYVGHIAETTIYYEGLNSDSIVVAVCKDYDRYRNITRYTYKGIVGNGNAQMFNARIKYKQNIGYNLVSLPESVVIFNHDSSAVLQLRTAEYNSKGGLTRLTRHNITQNAVWDFAYDIYGNMDWALLPTNENNQRLEFKYSYDTIVHTYPTDVTNISLGFVSSTNYEFLYGKPTRTTDINGNEMWYQYDALGRTIQITAPYEQDIQQPYTIKMEYYPHNYSDFDIFHNDSNPYSYASTLHFDKQHPNNPIITTTISDGLGRLLQTKKDAEIDGHEKVIVSGKVIYDCFGRTTKQYYPFVENLGTESIYNNTYQVDTLTETHYDIMDRQTRIILPTNDSTIITYGFDTYSGKRLFATATTDAKNNKVTVLKDALGQQILSAAPMNAVTRFDYDCIGQLIKSTDPDGFETRYEYDMLSRLTLRCHSDAGIDRYCYDPAGNITLQVNAKNDSIRYKYHFNQLTDITFSQYPANNVHYQYGTSANTNVNAVGKVILQEDASGWQSFSYGKLGEITRNIRTFVLPNEAHPYTFTMAFEYDSWNRIQFITYPDGERVNYKYNRGGMLNTVKGVKNGISSVYIKNIDYNEFELKSNVIYGNGAKTSYKYDILQRLSNLHSTAANNEVMQDINYSYDEVSNIVEITNSAGPISSGMGGTYHNLYQYDNLYRLENSNGTWNESLGFTLNMAYYANGRIAHKDLHAQILQDNGGITSQNYSRNYQYNNNLQPNTLTKVTGSDYQLLQWDATGNLRFHNNEREGFHRYFCWDEQNRLQGVSDENWLSYYQYDAAGERTYKLTGKYSTQNINGSYYRYANLVNATLYASPYLVATNKGYTKHYYAETERIASKIGGGNLTNLTNSLVTTNQFKCKLDSNDYHLKIVTNECLNSENWNTQELLRELFNYRDSVHDEKECFWYHPDHLGSSSWITTVNAKPVQHLHYLPWGEDFINQRASGYIGARYTFSAKERDTETGYSYFGSRYYNSDLSIWLSVDPMAHKYPSLSPYTYCANNPIRLVDPNGEDWFENELTGDVYYNRDYRKGDEKSLEGKGWKWMGSNNMFDKSDNDAINSNLDKVSDVSCRQDGVDGIANATFTGDNAEAFMNNMGYEKRPLVQDVSVKSVTQTFPDAMGPNSFSHTETSEYVIKTHSWTYAKNTSAIRYSVLSRKNVKDDINFFTSTHTYSATERRMYDYSMSSKKQSVIDACIEVIKTISKMF